MKQGSTPRRVKKKVRKRLARQRSVKKFINEGKGGKPRKDLYDRW